MTAEAIAIQFAVSTLTGVLVAWVTVAFALNRFRQERWWEKRLQAYTDIVMALYHIRRDLNAEMDSLMLNRERPFGSPLALKHTESVAELERIVAMGELLISQGAMDILSAFFQETKAAGDVGHEQGFVMYIEAYLTVVDRCLDRIKPEAKADLRIRRFSWSRSKG
jgi:hypothetical protein